LDIPQTNCLSKEKIIEWRIGKEECGINKVSGEDVVVN
jgi:hypothetical protein